MTSRYEFFVMNLLNKEGILYERERTFPDLKGSKNYLRYDFAVYNKKSKDIEYLIEVNGEQHYKSIKAWGGKTKFKKRQEYDRKKMKYALTHNIKMICLPFWDINNKLTCKKLFTNPKYQVKSMWHNDKIQREGK